MKNKNFKVINLLRTLTVFVILISISSMILHLNMTRSGFSAKAPSNKELSVSVFSLECRILDDGNNEVNEIELNKDYTLEVYNKSGIPCSFYISTEGSRYNTLSGYINIITDSNSANRQYCDMCNCTDDYLDHDQNIIEVRNFIGTDNPLKFDLRLDSSYISDNIKDLSNIITDYDFNFKLKLESWSL